MDSIEKIPLNIWNNIENTYGVRLDLTFESKRLVGIHNSGLTNIVSDIDFIIKGLKIYRDEMALHYGEPNKNHKSYIFSYVYLMFDKNTGFYKIGESLTPNHREKTLQSEKPTIEIIFVSKLTEKNKERELHKLFKQKRVRGEWFILESQDIEIIKNYEY